MADKYDPYRESLVIETSTNWPPNLVLAETDRLAAERQLHATAESAAELEYLRLHTGFCRIITVTPADLQRLQLT